MVIKFFKKNLKHSGEPDGNAVGLTMGLARVVGAVKLLTQLFNRPRQPTGFLTPTAAVGLIVVTPTGM